MAGEEGRKDREKFWGTHGFRSEPDELNWQLNPSGNNCLVCNCRIFGKIFLARPVVTGQGVMALN